MCLKERKEELLETSKRLYNEKLVAGTSGNISVYIPEEDIMIITPGSLSYETMKLEDLVSLKLDGTIVGGSKKPSSEWRMHAKFYKEREDISGIVHTHSPYATAFAVCQEAIPVILIEMVFFLGGDVPVAKFAMPGSEQIGIEALAVMAARTSCLLSNHGTLSVGKDLSTAFESAIYLEDAAKIYNLAKSSGNVQIIPEKFVEKMKG